jgi:nucleoside-diphosphate-sugar epimerase
LGGPIVGRVKARNSICSTDSIEAAQHWPERDTTISDLALVTGASGFLGACLVRQLIGRGGRVRALCRTRDASLEEIGAELVLSDIRDRETVGQACEGVDVVYHVAGVAGIWGPWDHYYSINTLGTQHVVDGCLAHGVGRLVYTSSPSVTFDGQAQEGIDETAPYPQRWLCHYPHTKALAEQIVLQANGKEGLLTCSLRPHLIWGPGDRHLVPRLVARARAGKLRRVGDGETLVDMTYVDNAASAHMQAADALRANSPVAGKAYFISQGDPVNCWQWIDEILGLAGLPPVQKSISLKAAWRIGSTIETIWRILRIQSEPRMTRFLAAQLGTSHYFDISRARDDFGYSPQISIEDGMARLGDVLEKQPESR